MMTQKLPLFPLNTVLFPSAHLPLHIFEERYRLMIGRCIEQQTPFGVVLLREGTDVDTGQPTVLHNVGTMAHIDEHVKLDDGRFYISTTGRRRFRIQYLLQRAPYLVASVSLLPDEASTDAAGPADQLRMLYQRYWESMSAATGFQVEGEQLSSDVAEMTYQLCHQLQVENELKQHWLESDLSTRLHELSAVLREEMALRSHIGPRPVDSSWRGPGSWN